MKIRRNRFRSLVITICAIGGVFIGSDVSSVLRLNGQFPFIPTAKVVHASPPSALSNAQPSPAVDPCPPLTISGTVGTGSPDYPFITGNQASRLFRNAVESDCGSAKPNP